MLRDSIQDNKYDEYVERTDEVWHDVKNACALLEDRSKLPIEDKVRIMSHILEQNQLYIRTVQFYVKK